MIVPSSGIFALSVQDRLDMVPALQDPSRVVEPLAGGLTNTNYKVRTARGTYVARLSRASSDLLAIDRNAEHQNSMAAAAAGIAPAVVDYVAAAGVLVIDWIDGRTLETADLRTDSILARVAAACRRLHEGPRFVSDFDMFEVQARYLKTVQERGFRLPVRYAEFMPQMEQIRTVLSMDPPPAVPCHNDLLAANFIDDGSRMWLIDYEYSGNNDPSFELGNIWSESNLLDDQLEPLVSAYCGVHCGAMTARARLQAVVSQYGWTLWGVIQHAVSELDFDFWAWAMEKYERAIVTFNSPAFTDLLTAVARPNRTSATEKGETL